MRKSRAQPIAGLRGTSVSNAVGNYDEVSRGVQRLPALKKYGVTFSEKTVQRSSRAVKKEHCIRNMAGRITYWISQSDIVNLQVKREVSAAEMKIPDDEI
jgi:hypothetical protein